MTDATQKVRSGCCAFARGGGAQAKRSYDLRCRTGVELIRTRMGIRYDVLLGGERSAGLHGFDGCEHKKLGAAKV